MLSSHYQYTSVPWVLGPIKLRKLPLLHYGEASVIKWKAIACRLLLCEFLDDPNETEKKKQIRIFGSPNLAIQFIQGKPKKPNLAIIAKPLGSLTKKWNLS
jgi:hypothetical protein